MSGSHTQCGPSCGGHSLLSAKVLLGSNGKTEQASQREGAVRANSFQS